MWKSAIPYYGIAMVWMICALRFDLYKLNHFLLVSFVSIGVFLLLDDICGNNAVEKDAVASARPEEKLVSNSDLDEVIRNGGHLLHEMRQINLRIKDREILDDIIRVEGAAQKILEHIQIHPEKLPQIRLFLNYYLPITLKLLKAYDSLNATGISGRNIDNTMARITNMMSLITSAFDAQLDKLFGSEALDITSDITVLEKMLRQEGLIGEHMEAKNFQSGDMANTEKQA